jgi:leucyl aminopeptidase
LRVRERVEHLQIQVRPRGVSRAQVSSADVVRWRGRTEFLLKGVVDALRPAGTYVVGAFADGTLLPSAERIDIATHGALTAVIEGGDFDSRAGGSIVLYDLPGGPSHRLVLVSLGPRESFTHRAFASALAAAGRLLVADSPSLIVCTLAEVHVPGRSVAWRLRHTARFLADGFYIYVRNRTQDDGRERPHRIEVRIPKYITPDLEFALQCGAAIGEGLALAKDLANLPPNVCTPDYLAEVAVALGAELGMDVEVLDRADMKRLGMGSALAMARGENDACKFIVVKHMRGERPARPVVLVGKGVTFDSGAILLKRHDDLDLMKYEMCGAASVLGALKMIGRVQLPLNVIGLIGAVESMPGGATTRPGDVVTSLSGRTIEILDTDPGRLMLCDALTYAERFNPACVIDIATMQGGCATALGALASGLFANDDTLANELLRCGTDTCDRAWRLPLWEEYQEALQTNFADISTEVGRRGGDVGAACFLSSFATAYSWAHLDAAATAFMRGDMKGATGRPVPLLAEFLLRRAARSPSADVVLHRNG